MFQAMRMKRKHAIEKKIEECPYKDDGPSKSMKEISQDGGLGTWKLKSSNSFKVPLERPMNLKTKLNDMICCEAYIFKIKKSFNMKLFSLQQEKDILEHEIATKNNRVTEIQHILGNDDVVNLISSNNEDLLSSISLSSNEDEKNKASREIYELSSLLPQIFNHSTSALNRQHLSKLEIDEIEERKTLIEFESKKLTQDIKDMVASFDESIFMLKKERFSILLETKICEINLFTMFHELELLQQFEDTDKLLKEKLDYQNREKTKVRKMLKNTKLLS